MRCQGKPVCANNFGMKADIRIRFARRLRELRVGNGLTQERLAGLSGVDYKHIQRLEGKNPPAVRIDTLEKIARAFDVGVAELMEM